MQRILFCLLFSLCLLSLAKPSSAQRKVLQARFSHCIFQAPGVGQYLETYTLIDGFSVGYSALGNGKFNATVEATLVVSQGDSVRYFDKFNLLGPETSDTLSSIEDFNDVHRIGLSPGKYTLELELRDSKQSDNKAQKVVQEIEIPDCKSKDCISDIKFISRHWVDEREKILKTEPLVDDFFDRSRESLSYYAELYPGNVDGQDLLLTYKIILNEGKRIMDSYTGFKRLKYATVIPVLNEIDIRQLPSGNYQLVLELRNKENILLAEQSVFFQRSNPVAASSENGELVFSNRDLAGTFVLFFTDKDSLAEAIRSLWPISNPNENTFAINQLSIANLVQMQQFFYDFWYRRNPATPQDAWMKYAAEVKKVNDNYSVGRKKGYMTERGRVYLRYGIPNQISRNYNEPGTYPYEIWQYYTIGNQTNRKFIFFCPEIGGNDFSLLHSDARGEIFDSQWMVRLKRRTETMNDVDKTKVRTTYGDNFEQIFQNPR